MISLQLARESKSFEAQRQAKPQGSTTQRGGVKKLRSAPDPCRGGAPDVETGTPPGRGLNGLRYPSDLTDAEWAIVEIDDSDG
jgi:hypothetical protein